MRKQTLFSSILFIGFGIYFILQQYHVAAIQFLFAWPTLLALVGFAYLFQAYVGKQHEAILPGVMLTGLGIHFHLSNYLEIWPEHSGVFLLLVALGLLLTYVKTGNGLFPGFLFFIASGFILFFSRLEPWAIDHGFNVKMFGTLWPLLFIFVGTYYLIKRK